MVSRIPTVGGKEGKACQEQNRICKSKGGGMFRMVEGMQDSFVPSDCGAKQKELY